MISDERISLNENTVLTGKYGDYIIGSVRGLGGSSIVYNGVRQGDSIPILIKELYPCEKNRAITRHGNIICIEENFPDQIKQEAEEFFEISKKKAYDEQKLITNLAAKFYAYSDLSLDCFEQNNTIYTIFQNKDDSCVLSDEPQQSFRTYLIYTRRILEALEPLHLAGYLHLDISPDNIYKTKMGTDEPILRLIDFNASIQTDQIDQVKYLSSKKGFSAYEIVSFKKDKIGFSTDLYSVTACLFFWLLKRTPNAIDCTNLSLLSKQAELFANIPENAINRCNEFLYKGLQSNPKKRFQSASEMLAEIKKIIEIIDKKETDRQMPYENINERLLQATVSLEKIEKNLSVNKPVVSKKKKKIFLVAGLIIVLAALIPITFLYVSNLPKTISFEDGSVYVGHVKNGVASGQGKITYLNGDTYEGEWKNGKKNGEGINTTSIYIYKGLYVNDKKEGAGKLIYKNVLFDVDSSEIDYYDGEWKNDYYEGKGDLHYANGNIYSGDFVNGLFDGKGDFSCFLEGKGWLFSGDWENGMQKFGILTYGELGYGYYGPFTNGMLNGVGVLIFDSGLQIQGYFVNFELDGEATLSLPDGSTAIASFLDNIPTEDIIYRDIDGNITKEVTMEVMANNMNGMAEIAINESDISQKLTNEDGSVYIGQIENGLANGKGKMTYANGDTYEGELKNNKMNGEGTYISSTYSYKGTFMNGKKEGYGRIDYKYPANDQRDFDTKYYDGEWINDYYDGKGEFQYINGDTYIGEFENGFFDGKGTYTAVSEDLEYTFSGDWKRGLYSFGMLTYPKLGFSMYGTFINSVLNGEGTVYYDNGLTISGNFINSNKNGLMTLSMQDGQIALVNFKDNLPTEDIIYKDYNGNITKIITLEEALQSEE